MQDQQALEKSLWGYVDPYAGKPLEDALGRATEALRTAMAAYVGGPVDTALLLQHHRVAPLLWPVLVEGGQEVICSPGEATAFFVVDPEETVVEVDEDTLDLTLIGELINIQKRPDDR